MSMRLTDTTKWDDDWFLDLSLPMKVAWQYIVDNCDGCGFLKLSLKLMSFRIGHQFQKSDLIDGLGDRIIWISEDQIWIPGFMKVQYKTLSTNNKAHRNMVAKTLKALAGCQLSGRAQSIVDVFEIDFPPTDDPPLTLIRPSIDPPLTLDGTSKEGQGTPIGNRIKDKGNRKSSKRGSAEGDDGLLAIYAAYPRKENRSAGLKTLKRDVAAGASLAEIARALERYNAHCAQQGTTGKFIKHFSTWASHWRDWLEPNAGESKDFSTPESTGDVDWNRYVEATEGGIS